MLGRALDAAAANEQQQQQSTVSQQGVAALETNYNEERHSLYNNNNNGEYGSIAEVSVKGGEEEEAVVYHDNEDDLIYAEDDDDDSFTTTTEDEDEEAELLSSSRRSNKCFNTIRRWIVLVANVDNLWDTSPTTTHQHSSYDHRYYTHDNEEEGYYRNTTRRRQLIVLFWFGILSTAYAVERTTFKLLVDRAGPFRLFSAQVITTLHALLMLMTVLIPQLYRKFIVSNRRQQQEEEQQQTARMVQLSFWQQGLGIPIMDLGIMALMDTIHLLMLVITGSHVPPTLTVILIQLTIPLTAFFSQFLHPDGCCKKTTTRASEEATEIRHHSSSSNSRTRCNSSGANSFGTNQSSTMATTNNNNNNVLTIAGRPVPGCGGMSMEHLWGSVIILCAVFLGLVPATVSLFEPQWFLAMDVLPARTAINTWLYALACIPAALSQLYKEYSFVQHKQPPVNANQLNGFLSALQLLFLIMISPLVYALQGLMGNTAFISTNTSSSWLLLYPSSEIGRNFMDGYKCFWGVLDEGTELRGYPEYAECGVGLVWIVLAHVVSISLVGVAVDKIFKSGATKIMFRGVSIGIVLAVTAMYIYDIHDSDFNYGPLIDSLWLLCTVVLILGAEVYHRVTLSDATFETVHHSVLDYDDDEEDDYYDDNYNITLNSQFGR